MAAAAKAREPRLGLKARRRLRQQEARLREREMLSSGGGAGGGASGLRLGLGGGLFGLLGTVASTICPPPIPAARKMSDRPPATVLNPKP